MYRSRCFALVLPLLLLVGRLAAQQGPQPAPPPTVVSSGHGSVRVQPDRATVIVTIETRSGTAAGAARDNARRVQATLDTLRGIGLAPAQLSTAGFSVLPDYQDNQSAPLRIVGYTARHGIRVELRQLDQVGSAIDAALAGGASSVGDVEFSASDVDAARHAALTAAVSQAQGDADAMARAAGGTLGALLDVSSEPSDGIRPIIMPRLESAAKFAATRIEPGDITVEATVTSRWAVVAR